MLKKRNRKPKFATKFSINFTEPQWNGIQISASNQKILPADLIRQAVERYTEETDSGALIHFCKFCKERVSEGLIGISEASYKKARKEYQKSQTVFRKAKWLVAHYECFEESTDSDNLFLKIEANEIKSAHDALKFISDLRTQDTDWVFLTDWQDFLKGCLN